MTATPPATKSRLRRVRWRRWLIVLAMAVSAYGGWREYTKRRAIRLLEQAGFVWVERSIVTDVRADWHNLFNKESWASDVRYLTAWDEGSPIRIRPEDLRAAIIRLAVSQLDLTRMPELIDLDVIRGIDSIRSLSIVECPALENITALNSLPKLGSISIEKCPALTELTGIADLPELVYLLIIGKIGTFSAHPLTNLPNLEGVYLIDVPAPRDIIALSGLPGLMKLRIELAAVVPSEEIIALNEEVIALKKARPNLNIEFFRMGDETAPSP